MPSDTRKRNLKTRVGEIELSVPRLRTLNFQTMVVERYRRMEISLEEALIEMYFLGLSTRKITDVTEMLADFPLSSSAQSRLNKKVYAKLEEWRERPISAVIPYLWLDGIVMKVRVLPPGRLAALHRPLLPQHPLPLPQEDAGGSRGFFKDHP